MAFVFVTSVVLLIITIMVMMNLNFGWIFYTTCAGQLMVIIMVYKVLRDNYSTKKTFDDFYEDYSVRE